MSRKQFVVCLLLDCLHQRETRREVRMNECVRVCVCVSARACNLYFLGPIR
jgi:hypothetical protein